MTSINKKLLKDSIVRKRLSVANFQKQNVIKENFSHIYCIPVNGISSDIVQTVRSEFKKSGYGIKKYTTKSFINKMLLNDFKLDKNNISGFYLGQMLIVYINIPIADRLAEKEHLLFLKQFLASFELPIFSSLLYPVTISISKKILVINSASEKTKELDKIINLFESKNVVFHSINNIVFSIIQLLISRIILLLQIISYKQNNKDIKNL